MTHRCADREFFLWFAKERDAYREWLRVGVNRYHVPVLGYTVTSNHTHVVCEVRDRLAVAGAPAVAQPALGLEGYPSSWQTWRMAVPPGSPTQPFTVRIADLPGPQAGNPTGQDVGRTQRRFAAFFLPQKNRRNHEKHSAEPM